MGSLFLFTLLGVSAVNALSVNDLLFHASQQENGVVPSIPLRFQNGVATIDFSLGTPGQNFTGVFDTGSPFTWATSDKCTAGSCASVPNKNKFHRLQSSTNKPLPTVFDYSYIDGTHVRLQPELDTVTFSDALQFPAHLFGEALEVQGAPPGSPATARVGLGGYSQSAIQKVLGTGIDAADSQTPSLLKGGLIKRAAGDDHYATGYGGSGSPGFKKLGKRAPLGDIQGDSSSSSGTAEFRWVLGSDKDMYHDPLYDLPLVPVGTSDVDSPFWKIPIKGLALARNDSGGAGNGTQANNSQEYPFSNGMVGEVASSLANLLVPSHVADAVNQAIGATKNNEGVYTLSCNARQNGPSLVIHLETVDAILRPQHYIARLEHVSEGTDGCYSTLAASPNAQVYLGGPFFRAFYLEYALGEKKLLIAESATDGLGSLHAAAAH
ncbi:aspartic peptidase domain-containing protein [Syncephalastrum racemosum]|uniref:Aspartic peptidase domain-containing protein n=1 Tax=Syncephalastrum racemosum TaxID=13706 RepID=A0A1X2HFG1_SYNRA|nr:aspartic peptidase domain-containing protein [Syncephalastrum racemosum]